MADFFVNAAATRGRVRVTNTDVGLPPEPWEVWTRDNFAGVVPVAAVNQNESRGVEVRYTATSGSTTSVCGRYFMAFDTSVITDTVTYAELNIFKQATGLGNSDFMPVKATAPTTTVNVGSGSYNAIFQYQPGYPMNANLIGNVVNYADTETFGTVDGWNAIPLNAAAFTDINLLTQFKLALVNYTYDYLYQSPTIPTNLGTAVNALTNPPYLYIVTGTGQWVLSIDPALTFKVNSVTGTNIKFVNRAGAIEIFRWDTGGVAGSSNPGCGAAGSAPPYIPIYTQFGMSAPNGAIVYSDAGLTVPFNGSSIYWSVDPVANNPFYGGQQWQISATGVILDNTQGCGF